MARELRTKSWYDHMVEYVDMKWPHASPNRRKGIAEMLADVTPVLLATERGSPGEETLRRALYRYVCNAGARAAGEPPAELAGAVEWLAKNTVDLSALKDAALARKVSDAIAIRCMDGKPAAARTVARKRRRSPMLCDTPSNSTGWRFIRCPWCRGRRRGCPVVWTVP